MSGTVASDVDALSAEIDAILSSKQLAKSPALVALLEYLRDRYPDKSSDPTTEYAIAQDLMGHGASFDPKTDPNVRVRVRRLRDALAEYYKGRSGGVMISIPSRSYDLELGELRSKPFYAQHIRIALGAVAAVSATFLLISFAVWKFSADPPAIYPLIKILPIQNLTGDADNDIFEDGLQRQLGSDIQRFGRVRVFIASPPERDISGADFTLRASILQLDDEIDLAFRLERGNDYGLIYGNRIKGSILGENYYDGIANISEEISGQIAGQGGPVSERHQPPAIMKAGLLEFGGVGTDVFQCIILGDRFFDNYEVKRFLEAYRCFESVLPKIGDDPVSLASWGTLLYHTVPEFNLMQTDQLPPAIRNEAQDILAMATTNAKRFPQSAEAFLLLGAVQNSLGMLRQAEVTLRQSIGLNPARATTHAALAYVSLSGERFEEATEMAEEAIRLSAEPQGYIYLPIFLSALVLDQELQAIEAGTAYAYRRKGNGAIAVNLIIARLTNDESVIEHLSPVVAAMPDPLSGFGGIVRGQRTREALQEVLPEVDFEKIFQQQIGTPPI